VKLIAVFLDQLTREQLKDSSAGFLESDILSIKIRVRVLSPSETVEYKLQEQVSTFLGRSILLCFAIALGASGYSAARGCQLLSMAALLRVQSLEANFMSPPFAHNFAISARIMAVHCAGSDGLCGTSKPGGHLLHEFPASVAVPRSSLPACSA